MSRTTETDHCSVLLCGFSMGTQLCEQCRSTVEPVKYDYFIRTLQKQYVYSVSQSSGSDVARLFANRSAK